MENRDKNWSKTPPQTSPQAFAAQASMTPIAAHYHKGPDAPQIDYNDLVNKPTVPVIYGGIINSTVANSTLPTGWSASKLGTGDYVVTHNLGTANYSIVATTYTYVVSLGTVDSNTFEVLVTNLSGTATDANVNFILYPF